MQPGWSRHWSRRQLVQGAGVAGLGLLAACGRRPFQDDQPAKVHQIGFLTPGPGEATAPLTPEAAASFDAFRQSLSQYGYLEGQNLAIEYRVTDQGEQRLRELAAGLIERPVDIIVASAEAALPAKQTTRTIPIVFTGGGDPVLRGLVSNIGRPDGNVTGIPAEVQGTLVGKRLQLLKEAAPGLSRVATLWEVSVPIPEPVLAQADAPARALGLQSQRLEVRSPDELALAFEMASQSHVDGLLFIGQPALARHRVEIANLALQYHLPSMGTFQDFAQAGGLMAYGTSRPAMIVRAAYYVDRILGGAKPADLPIEQPREFEFVINLEIAQALGLTIPQHVLLQATEVIQ